MNDKDHDHIYKPFDAELRSLKDMILAMGGLVEAHIADAVRSLIERDPARAEVVVEGDRQVNAMEIGIDELCIRMLALRQPAAGDLRFVAAALKINTDLERIGDLAVNMAERSRALAALAPFPKPIDLGRMASSVMTMLASALDAFVARDVPKAESVLKADDAVDKTLVEVFDQVLKEMHSNPASIEAGIAIIFFAKHLERLADHATNIAEMVVYVANGQDVRHRYNR